MQTKTICFSFLAGLLLAVATPAFAGVQGDVQRDVAQAGQDAGQVAAKGFVIFDASPVVSVRIAG